MLHGLRSHLSYANVVATGALFVALGGGAYALSGVPDRGGVYHGCVASSGALRVVASASLCRKTKTVRRGGRRVRIPGETAIVWNQQGRPGATGTNGTKGTNGTTNLIVRTKSANGSGALDVPCNPGERAVGGGIGRTDGSSDVNDKVGGTFPTVAAGVPAPNGSTATGWHAVWNGAVANVTTWVICASP
jgi:hypothetical protein